MHAINHYHVLNHRFLIWASLIHPRRVAGSHADVIVAYIETEYVITSSVHIENFPHSDSPNRVKRDLIFIVLEIIGVDTLLCFNSLGFYTSME